MLKDVAVEVAVSVFQSTCNAAAVDTVGFVASVSAVAAT